MIKYKIITDSSSGITQEEAKKLGVIVLPLTLSYDGKDYKDGIDISTNDFYKLFFENQEKKGMAKLDVFGLFSKDEKGFPKTSMITPAVFEATFNEVIAEGYMPLVLPISKVLSGTLQSAIIARDMIDDNDDIMIVDSKTALGAVKVIILSILSKEYETKEELLNHVNYLVDHVNFYAVPETLAYLAKGGRLGKFSSVVGNLLRFKPVIQLDKNGSLVPIEKVRGLKHAYKRCNELFQENPADFNYPVIVGYSTVEENYKLLIENIKSNLPNNYDVLQISAVVGAHVGPGAAALFYIAKNDVNKNLGD